MNILFCVGPFQARYLIGRVGYVYRVYAHDDGDHLVIREDGAKVSVLNVRASHCKDVAEESDVAPIPALLDWRRVQKATREVVAEELQAHVHPENLEPVKNNTLLEHMTVKVCFFVFGIQKSNTHAGRHF